MSDRSLVISPAARDDLTAIYRVGEQTWGQSPVGEVSSAAERVVLVTDAVPARRH